MILIFHLKHFHYLHLAFLSLLIILKVDKINKEIKLLCFKHIVLMKIKNYLKMFYRNILITWN